MVYLKENWLGKLYKNVKMVRWTSGSVDNKMARLIDSRDSKITKHFNKHGNLSSLDVRGIWEATKEILEFILSFDTAEEAIHEARAMTKKWDETEGEGALHNVKWFCPGFSEYW